MGFTDSSHPAKESPSDNLAKTPHAPSHISLEGWVRPEKEKPDVDQKKVADKKTPTADKSAAPETKTVAADTRTTVTAHDRPAIVQADATTTPLRDNAVQQEQSIAARLRHNIDGAKNGTFAIKDVLSNFDKLYQDAVRLPLQAINQDLATIKNDPSQKKAADAELTLLHSPGVILATKALVAYDAAANPNIDKTGTSSRELVQIARTAAQDASKDGAVQKGFAPKFQALEALVKARHLDTDNPIVSAAEGATGQDSPQGKPNDTARDTTPAGTTTDGSAPTDQQLAAIVKAAKEQEPAKQAIEAQLWGASTDQNNSNKYLYAKASVQNFIADTGKYSEADRKELQVSLFANGPTVQEKQAYIDKVAANDKGLHDDATALLKLAGDKLNTLAKWYAADRLDELACKGYYAKSMAADKAGNTQAALDNWTKAQNYPLESVYATKVENDPDKIKLDQKMLAEHQKVNGDSKTYFAMARDAQRAGDYATAEKYYKESIKRADLDYQKNQEVAKKQVEDAHNKLINGAALKGDDKLAIAATAIPYTKVLTSPIEARNNAALALSELGQDNKGQYVAGLGAKKYAADIAQWLHESNDMSKNVDAKAFKTIGDTLAGAAANNLSLRQPGQEETWMKVSIASKNLIGGQMPAVQLADGTTIPASNRAGTAELSYTTPKLLAAFMVTQGHGTEAINALRDAATRESAYKGWDEKDSAKRDNQLGSLIAQAKPLDSNHYLDEMTRNESALKTPAQAIGGFLAFSATVYAATKLRDAAALEELAPTLAKEGILSASARNIVKYAPQLAGTGVAVLYSKGIDSLGDTHQGWESSALKGMSVVGLVHGGRYLSRVGALGFAPGVAEKAFGAAEVGGELSTTKVLGRMVTEASGKSLGESSEMTAGRLAEHFKGKLSAENLAKIRSLDPNTPIFENGVLNPKVDEKFLGASQRDLATTLQQSLGGKVGLFIPTPSEIAGAVKGSTMDVAEGDALSLRRQVALRATASRTLLGGAHKATELRVLQSRAMEVTGTKDLSEANYYRSQFVNDTKGASIPAKDLGSLQRVVAEDRPLLTGGVINEKLGAVDATTQSELLKIAEANGKPGELTTGELLNYATKNKIPTTNFESLIDRDPLLIKNGQYNPNTLLRDEKTGLVTRAIDDPNFKNYTNLDNMQYSQLYSKLAKRSITEEKLLQAQAVHTSQEVAADQAGNISKAKYVEDLIKRGETPESIAAKFPKLSKLQDDELIVKGGKFQTKVHQRDLPENMTAGEFKDDYLRKTGKDLRDPAVLNASPWKRALATVSDDAPIMKDGKWQISRLRLPREANGLVNDRVVELGKPKTIGLEVSGSKFLMKGAEANLNAGTYVSILEKAKLDPSKFAVSKMDPETPIVVKRTLAQVPKEEPGRIARLFRRTNEDISLDLNNAQRSVLSGDIQAGDVQTGFDWSYKNPAAAPFQWGTRAGIGVGKYVWNEGTSIAKTIWDTKGGLGIYGTVNPLEGSMAKQGARYTAQNFLYGTSGVAGSFGLYQAMQTAGNDNFNPDGSRISGSDAFSNALLGWNNGPQQIQQLEKEVEDNYQKEIDAMPEAERNALTDQEIVKTVKERVETQKAEIALKHNLFWMSQFYNSYQTVGKFPGMGFGFTAALPLTLQGIGGTMNVMNGTEAKSEASYQDALRRNNTPLVNRPDAVEAPVPVVPTPKAPDTQAAPNTQAAPDRGPSPDDMVPTPVAPSIKQGDATTQRVQPVRRPAQANTPARTPVAQPAQRSSAPAPGNDYIDNQL